MGACSGVPASGSALPAHEFVIPGSRALVSGILLLQLFRGKGLPGQILCKVALERSLDPSVWLKAAHY